MTPIEHPAKTRSPRTGILAALFTCLDPQGTGAPTSTPATAAPHAARRLALTIVATLLALIAALLLSTTPALAASSPCPNESLRVENELFRKTSLEEQLSKPVASVLSLPDCRAYEMVSPPFKEGDGLRSVQAVSGDGSSVLAASLGAFAGAEADSGESNDGGEYLFSRSGSGWIASAVSPPASLFPNQAFLAASPDLEETLWRLRTGSQSIFTEDLYVREADGSVVEIGPMVPPLAAAGPPAGGYQEFYYDEDDIFYADASADLSHVLFTITNNGPVWPGDTTQQGVAKASLYEYAGRGQVRPELVGVSDGSTVVDGETRPAGQLISNCGTLLGSQDDVYNALSADGATVFFTAGGGGGCTALKPSEAPEVSEVYARLDQLQTVAVSEPTAAACAACLTPATVAEGRRAGVFAGASEDGSKVFFLTEQELLAGAGGMNLYEYDFDVPESRIGGPGRIVRVSTGSGEPQVQGVARVSEDGSHVYFVARGVLTTEPDLSLPAGHQQPLAGGDNLYVFQRDAAYPAGQVSFIATLCSGEEQSGTLSGVAQCPSSLSDAQDWGEHGGEPGIDLRPVQATPDGRFVVFQSAADLTPGDTGGTPQVFEYDAQNGELVRVSTGQQGSFHTQGTANANANGATIETPEYFGRHQGPSPTTATTGLALSEDGSTVLFESVGALSEGALAAEGAGAESVYEYRSVGAIGDGSVSLISDGTNTLEAVPGGLDASGEDAFFATADPLLPQDADGQYDIYDARVDGGFAAADPPADTSASPSASPVLGVPASETFTGPGDQALSASVSPALTPVASKAKKVVKCRKGKVSKHKRCVKRRAKRASNDGRARS